MHVISVSQATAYLRELLESDLILGDVWISCEVSGPRTQPSGHTYFVLKDANAQLRGVMFRSAMMRQRKMADYLEHGAQVIVHGRLTVYEARGELQIVVDFVQPEGVGLRQAQFEKLRMQLEEEGLFDPGRKRALPVFPKKIGVVTSQSGAVFHDICNVLRRRWPLAHVILAPTPVQGPEAPFGIVAGIEALNRRGEVDVIIVARGGGSVEELWAFNEEAVARAVFASVIPTVSAVGHETDTTICDWVADVRAPTPSAAAELIAPDSIQLEQRLAAYTMGAYAAVRRKIDRHLTATTGLLNRAARSSADVSRHRQRIDDFERRALNSVAAAQRDRRAHLRRCEAQLVALDPNATLKRGYAVVHKDGHVVSTIAGVSSGDRLIIKIADGGFGAQVAGPATRRTPRRAAAPSSNGNGAKKNGASAKEPGVQPVLFP